MTRWGQTLRLLGAALAVLLACRPEPRSASPAVRPTGDAGLRPLTSRDEVPAADPHASGTLPSGHPPIDGAHGAAGASAAEGGSVSGTVDVAPALKGRIRGGALFLIARNAKSRQIVAVRKMDDASLPQKFDLSGVHAMTPGTPFEGPLNVTARWSQHGDAMPAPGDIEGTVTDVAVGNANLKVVLADVRK